MQSFIAIESIALKKLTNTLKVIIDLFVSFLDTCQCGGGILQIPRSGEDKYQTEGACHRYTDKQGRVRWYQRYCDVQLI